MKILSFENISHIYINNNILKKKTDQNTIIALAIIDYYLLII